MNIRTILLASAAMFALSAPAFAVDKETYESTTRIEKNLSVEVDSKGNIDKSKSVERVSDPKGLGNKHIVITRDTEKTKDGKVTSTHEKTVDGKNVEGTNDKYKSTSEVQKDAKGNYAERDITTKTDADGTNTRFEKDATVTVDAQGNVDKSTTTKKVTDPKGLMNKNTVKTSATETIKDGTRETSQKIKVNGETISSETTSAPAR